MKLIKMVSILRLTFRAMWAFHTTKEHTMWANITVSSKSEAWIKETIVMDRQFKAWFTKIHTAYIYYMSDIIEPA